MKASKFTAEQRRLLMKLTEVVPAVSGKAVWTTDPDTRSATLTSDGLALLFRETLEEDWVFYVRWDDEREAEGHKLASDVRQALEQWTSRQWSIGQKSGNRCYIKKA